MGTSVISRTVLFGECDPAGIVYTPRFTDFALEATHQALSERLGQPCIRALKAAGIVTPVRHSEIEYLQPLHYDQLLEQEVAIHHIGQHSYSFIVSGRVEEQPVYQASISYVTLCQQRLQKTPVPTWLKEVFQSLKA